ncbi:MAG: GrpB family protein [Candidatus Sungbacteria bacterium]|nr:GrpB family protein [Candidatus Sungbacteria bacterium]
MSAESANNMNAKPNRPFEVVEYDANWIKEFEKRREKLKEILGDDIVDIQHVGSTAILGMIAKPQIDILIVVENLDTIRSKYDEMRASGFEPRGDYAAIGEEYFTEDTEQGVRLASIHILPQGHPEIAATINFRDYPSTHQEDRDLYGATKKELFIRHADNYLAYGREKSSLIETIRERANQWARQLLDAND